MVLRVLAQGTTGDGLRDSSFPSRLKPLSAVLFADFCVKESPKRKSLSSGWKAPKSAAALKGVMKEANRQAFTNNIFERGLIEWISGQRMYHTYELPSSLL